MGKGENNGYFGNCYTCYTCYTCGHTLECSLGVKRPSHRNPMYLSEVSVDGVFESVHSGSCYNLLWESIPCVNNTLTEVVLKLLQPET